MLWRKTLRGQEDCKIFCVLFLVVQSYWNKRVTNAYMKYAQDAEMI